MKLSSESIFFSALRSFFRMFFAVFGILFAFFFFSMIYSSFSETPLLEEKTMMTILPDAQGRREKVALTSPVVLQINIHGVIENPMF